MEIETLKSEVGESPISRACAREPLVFVHLDVGHPDLAMFIADSLEVLEPVDVLLTIQQSGTSPLHGVAEEANRGSRHGCACNGIRDEVMPGILLVRLHDDQALQPKQCAGFVATLKAAFDQIRARLLEGCRHIHSLVPMIRPRREILCPLSNRLAQILVAVFLQQSLTDGC